MSFGESHDSLPTPRLDEKDDHIEQFYQDSRSPSSGIGSPTPRATQLNGYPPAVLSSNGSLKPTEASSSYFAEREPINNAVASAFHTTASDIPPDLIQLITQNVIQQLNAHKAGSAPSSQPVQPPTSAPADQPGTPSSSHGSPSLDRANVYTPPSPHPTRERPEDSRTMPSSSSNTSNLNTYGYNTARRRDLSPFSHASNDEMFSSDAEQRAKRSEARKKSPSGDETVIERHWGKLFDEHGQATDRLTHFLQGIAVHLIEELEPKHSLVITPEKMQRYYDTTRLETLPELYPWQHIFDDKTSCISRLLRDSSVKVEHHLVQSSPDARPDIPGLTPVGFATWMILLIRAHPNQEFERLAKTLRLMAINHPERRTERFPAAISRRLFPSEGDESISIRLTNLMALHCKVQINPRNDSLASTTDREAFSQRPLSPQKSEAPPPPTVEEVIDESELQEPATKRSSFISTADSTTSRLRETMSNTDSEPSKAPSVTSIEDEGPESYNSQIPFERERKPYVAQPGGGKSYDVTSSGDETPRGSVPDKSDLRRTKSVSSSQRSRAPPPIAIHQRSQQQDGADLSRARTSVPLPDSYEQTSVHRSRSNSAYGPPPAFRRSRSNSTYANEPGTRYHSKRSPSLSKSGFDPFMQRGNGSDAAYVNYPTSNSTSVPLNSSSQAQMQPQVQPQQERYEHTTRRSQYDPRNDLRTDPRNDPRSDPRNDPRNDRAYDPGARGSRQRHQSVAAVDGSPYFEDNYRGRQAYAAGNTSAVDSTGGSYQYPPNAYRDAVR